MFRWKSTAEDLSDRMLLLVGDVFLSAACISYTGAFTEPYRQKLVQSWILGCQERQIPASPSFSLQRTLSSQVQVNKPAVMTGAHWDTSAIMMTGAHWDTSAVMMTWAHWDISAIMMTGAHWGISAIMMTGAHWDISAVMMTRAHWDTSAVMMTGAHWGISAVMMTRAHWDTSAFEAIASAPSCCSSQGS
jgi:hypothetical protein